MYVGKENALVLEVKQRPKPPGAADTAEKLGRAFVGGDTAGGEQRHQSILGNERLRALDEQAVEIHVAAAQQWIVAAVAQHAGLALGALAGFKILVPQRRALLAQIVDHALAVGGAGLPGDVHFSLREPLHLLQLDAVPRWVSNHRVEPAAAGAPDSGKGSPPMEELLAPRERSCTGKQFVGAANAVAVYFAGVADQATLDQFRYVADAIKNFRNRMLGVRDSLDGGAAFGSTLLFGPTGDKPAHCTPEIEQDVDRRNLLICLVSERLGVVGLGNADVCQFATASRPRAADSNPCSLP